MAAVNLGAKCWESFPAPGKGSGVRAVRDIDRHELIVEEAPLWTLPGGIAQEMIINSDIGSRWFDQFYSGLANNVRELTEKLCDAPAEEGAWGKFCANALPPPAELGGGDACARSVFEMCSKFNHSCAPNCEYAAGFGKTSRIYAVRAIDKGEELCIAKCHTVHGASERAAELRDAGIPRCLCDACTSGEPADPEMEEFRELAKQGLCILDSPWKEHFDAGRFRVDELNSIAANCSVSRKALMRLGMDTPLLLQTCATSGISVAALLRDADALKRWAELLKVHSDVAFGASYPLSASLKLWTTDPASHPEWGQGQTCAGLGGA